MNCLIQLCKSMILVICLASVPVIVTAPTAIASRYEVVSRQVVYDNPCRSGCNNQYTTDEEAKIAYARQGTPVDGSPLMTCGAGITLSIDYGKPSYAMCIDFRVDLDAPVSKPELPKVDPAVAAAEAAAAEAAAKTARIAAQEAAAAAAAAAAQDAAAKKGYSEETTKAGIAAQEANAAAAAAEAEAARQAARASKNSQSETVKQIQFKPPTNLNATQLLKELAEAGVTVSGGLSMNGGWLQISMPENQSDVAHSVLSNHNGEKANIEAIAAAEAAAKLAAELKPIVDIEVIKVFVSEKEEIRIDSSRTIDIANPEYEVITTVEVQVVGDGAVSDDPLANIATGQFVFSDSIVVRSEVNSPSTAFLGSFLTCPLGSELVWDFAFGGDPLLTSINCRKIWTAYEKITTTTVTKQKIVKPDSVGTDATGTTSGTDATGTTSGTDVAEKAASEKAALELAAEKAASEKAALELAAEKAASEKAALELAAEKAAAAIDAANRVTEAAYAAAEAAEAKAAAEAADKAALELLAEKFAADDKTLRNFITYGKAQRFMFAERSRQF